MNGRKLGHATAVHKPYALVGSGRLTATIWKTEEDVSGWTYAFNIVRTNRRTGQTLQRFGPKDLTPLVKLVQVLAFTLGDDGCLSAELRQELSRLESQLRQVLETHSGETIV